MYGTTPCVSSADMVDRDNIACYSINVERADKMMAIQGDVFVRLKVQVPLLLCRVQARTNGLGSLVACTVYIQTKRAQAGPKPHNRINEIASPQK